ncbi:uncharacterized protein LOC115926205 isoform X1 [Strongylocentrotus purpuratus]|uniref:C-type lectin domain-containing protein n=1 Tax=Strongylocentrotus purpuratus TaxID=7668 RepID=A0A7M7P8H6_STRPU|nr:uncharacterized protein LOC115926205 isoform X1 [Strongylocentrotus purpuratus]
MNSFSFINSSIMTVQSLTIPQKISEFLQSDFYFALLLSSFLLYFKASCPSGSIGRLEYCYTLHSEPLSWRLAGSQCGFDGGFLTSIVNRQENDFLVESFGNLTSLAWIGMDSRGRWLDGSSSQLFYNNFRYETLNTHSCPVIDLDRNGRWNVSSCLDSRLDFICKKNKDVSGGRDSPAPTNGDDEEEVEGSSGKSNTTLKTVLTWIGVTVALVVIASCSAGNGAVGKCFCSCFIDMLAGLCGCIIKIPTRLCGWIYEWLCVIGLAIQVCFYRCLRCGGLCKRQQEGTERAESISSYEYDPEPRGALNCFYRCLKCAGLCKRRQEGTESVSSSDPEIREALNWPPLAETGLEDQSRATPSAPAEPHTDPPPAYGDVTSNRPQSTPTAPPPSPPPDNRIAPPSYDAALDPTFDIRPTNIRDETTAAPSYESVARS